MNRERKAFRNLRLHFQLAEPMSGLTGTVMLKTETTQPPVASSRRLAFGALASGTVNIMKVGLQLLLLPVMARLLGPTEFGIYALAFAAAGILSHFLPTGVWEQPWPESQNLIRAFGRAHFGYYFWRG